MLDSTKKTIAILTAAGCLGAGGWAIAADGGTTTTAQSTAQSQGQYGAPRGNGPVQQEQVTGATATKVTEAVLAKLPGASVERVEKDAAGYHAHVATSDGTHARVLVDTGFNVTAIQEGGPGNGPGPGGPGGPCDGDGTGAGGPGAGSGGGGGQGEAPSAPQGGSTSPTTPTTPGYGESTVSL